MTAVLSDGNIYDKKVAEEDWKMLSKLRKRDIVTYYNFEQKAVFLVHDITVGIVIHKWYLFVCSKEC